MLEKRRGNRRFGRSGNSRLVLLPEALCDSETSRFGPVLEEAQNPVNNHRNRRGRNSDATYGGFRPSPETAQTGNPQNRTMSQAVARFGRLGAARIEDSLVFFRENRLLRAPEGGPNSDPHEEMATRAARGRGRPGSIPGAVSDSEPPGRTESQGAPQSGHPAWRHPRCCQRFYSTLPDRVAGSPAKWTSGA